MSGVHSTEASPTYTVKVSRTGYTSFSQQVEVVGGKNARVSVVLQQEQTGLLESLTGTSLNFKSFLPLYIKYTLSPDCPLD